MTARVLHGDMLTVLPTLEAESIHAVVTDPPYHLTAGKPGGSGPASANPNSPAGRSMIGTGFMGKAWDGGDIAFRPETWAEVFRVMKPGAHLVAFGGTRTYHRMACAIEDAGFEIRDQLGWIYGSGFPKSLDVSKAIDKAAGVDREVLSRGAPVKRMIPGADQNGTGSWVKDNGRVFVPNVTAPGSDAGAEWSGWGTALKPAWEPIVLARKPLIGTVAANVLRHGCGGINVDACRIDLAPGDWLQDGVKGDYERMDTPHVDSSWGFKRVDRAPGLGRFPANVIHDGSDEVLEAFAAFGESSSGTGAVKRATGKGHQANAFGKESRPAGTPMICHGDSGSVARFFYCGKAAEEDRAGSKHPTVKPLALMSWLVKLITPPGGTVLDPFAGTGTTVLAADRLQFNAIGVEQSAEYVADIHRRLKSDAPLFAKVEVA